MTAVVTNPAVTAVKAAFAASLPVGWVLLDGIDPQQAFLPKSITVGGGWDSDQGALSSQNAVTTETEETGAARRLTEITDVTCNAYSGGGGTDFVPHRAAVNEALTAARTALSGIRAVDGLGARAILADQQWVQFLDDNGVGVMASFTARLWVLP